MRNAGKGTENGMVRASVLGISLLIASCGSPQEHTANQGKSDLYSLGGERLSPARVARHLREAGFPETAIARMVCTAKYESSFYSGALNVNRNGSRDYGLFQINDFTWLKACGVTGAQLMNPTVNAKCAFRIYSTQGITAWYGYTSHRAECDAYRMKPASKQRKVAAKTNKLFSGPKGGTAFCSNLPLGTGLTVHARQGEMLFVSLASGLCVDFKGVSRTAGWIPRAQTRTL